MHGRGFVLLVISVLVPLASVSGIVSGNARATDKHVGADTCLKVSSGLLTSLRSGLKPKARGKLGTARAVRSRDQITSGPRGFRAGAYIVSARVRGFGIATWAADARAFRTGGGFITVMGPLARRVSILGIDISVSTLRNWGLSETTHGYAASRRCVR